MLHLGGAGCALPWALDTTRPGSQQVVLEVDAALTALVRQWFDLPRSPRLRIQAADARDGLAARRDGSADAVVRDVFDGDTTPHRLCTVEMAQAVRRVLAPGGLYLAERRRPAAARHPAVRGRHRRARCSPTSPWSPRPRCCAAAGTPTPCSSASDAPVPHDAVQRRVQRSGLSLRVLHGRKLDDLVAGARPLRD